MSAPHSNDPEVRHVFDDIAEQDNRLPNWWLLILFSTIAFSFAYWLYYEATGVNRGPTAEYKAEAEALAKVRGEEVVTPEALEAATKDAAYLALGQETFKTTCASCHAAEGQGLVGPNLTDAYWVHGNRPEDIYKVVSEGVLAKAMPAWLKPLGPKKTKAVTAYVLSLKGKNVPGKAPEGQLAE